MNDAVIHAVSTRHCVNAGCDYPLCLAMSDQLFDAEWHHNGDKAVTTDAFVTCTKCRELKGLEPLVKKYTTYKRSELSYRFQILSLDVWGNKKDGYDVNQAFYTGLHVDIPVSEINDDKAIIKALVNADYYKRESLHARQMKHVEIEGEPEYTLYINHKGKPENNLQFCYYVNADGGMVPRELIEDDAA